MPSLAVVIAGAYFGVFALALLWNAGTYLVTAIAGVLRMRHLPDEPASDEPASVITLVHGTWAPRAAWTMPGSALRQTLARAAEGPVLFQRFIWSGRNSISARRRATRALIQHLHAVTGRWPRARHYMVAHSHGGNIALHALGDHLLHERIRGLICLSTPFLTVTPRDLGPVGKIALWWLPVILIIYGGQFALQQIVPAAADTLGPFVLFVAVGAGFLTSRRLERFATSGVASLEFPAVDPSKVLIVRAAADEASAALGATHIISWVSGRLWLFTSRAAGRTLNTVEQWRGTLARHRGATAVVAAGLALVCVLALLTPGANDSTARLRTGFVAGGLLLVLIATLVRGGLVAAFLGRLLFAAIAAPLLMLIAVLGLSVGPELLAAGLLFQVTAEATPPGRWVVWQVAAGPAGIEVSTGLSHSASYQSPAALEIIEKWIATSSKPVESRQA